MNHLRDCIAAAALASVAFACVANAQEASPRAVTGQLPLVGDREIFQPGTQPCTIPGVATSCFHTDHTDEFDRKFHPAQTDLLVTHSGDLPVATNGTKLPQLELVCASCHGGYVDPDSGEAATYSPFDTWRGTMMAQAWRDPLARAALAVANHGLTTAKVNFATGLYDNGPDGRTGRTAGDYCIRCHTPIGWLEGNSLPADGSRISGKQMDGVQCDACHRMVNPLTHTYDFPSNYNFVGGLPDSLLDPEIVGDQRVAVLHNGNFIVNTTGAKVGPYVDPADIDQHPLDVLDNTAPAKLSPYFATEAEENRDFVQSAQLCAVCHNVTNPILNRVLADGTDTKRRMPVERTYTEWYFSACGPAVKGNPNQPMPPQEDHDTATACNEGHRSCQSCHMPQVEGYAANPDLGDEVTPIPRRPNIARHTFVGGNAWAQDMIPFFFPDQLPLAVAGVFDAVQEKAREMLRSAADLDAELAGDGALRVTVTNLSGHKLPTGYPEGRRMWLEVSDGSGSCLSGCYDAATAVLTHDADLKIWAAELGIKKPGAALEESFSFIENNVVVMDNRIPPKGFDAAAAAAHDAIIVRRVNHADPPRDCRGYDGLFPASACASFDYEGGDGVSEGRDVVLYDLPEAVGGVRVRLRYQTASKEYIDFLTDPESYGTYGDRFTAGLRAAWLLTGMSPPVDMACVEVTQGGATECPP